MIEIDHLYFSYGSHMVLQDVSCMVKPGRMTFLIGQNGAGKSTLFRCILGQLHAQKGQVLLNQRASNQYTIREPICLCLLFHRKKMKPLYSRR